MDIHHFLLELDGIDWFSQSGAPTQAYHVVSSIFEAYDRWNRPMLDVWEPAILCLEKVAAERLGDAGIEEVFCAVSQKIHPLIYEKWGCYIVRHHYENEMGLEDEFMDMVKRDISWACIESLLQVHGLFTALLHIYKDGYFPCAWIGSFPSGQAVVL